MPTTPRGAPYPAPDGSNDVPGDIEALAVWANDRPGVSVMTSASRALLTGGHLWEGRLVFEADTRKLALYSAGAWRLITSEQAMTEWAAYTPTVAGVASLGPVSGWYRVAGGTVWVRGSLHKNDTAAPSNPIYVTVPIPMGPSVQGLIGVASIGTSPGKALTVQAGTNRLALFNDGGAYDTTATIRFTAEYQTA